MNILEIDIVFVKIIQFLGINDFVNFSLINKKLKRKYDDNKIWKSKLSGESKDFISKLLNVDSFQRMSCEEALKHPWLLKR